MIKWLLGVAPEVGSRWGSNKSPFPCHGDVVVTDVKCGYVAYQFTWSTTLLTRTVRNFRAIYTEKLRHDR